VNDFLELSHPGLRAVKWIVAVTRLPQTAVRKQRAKWPCTYMS